MRSRLTNQKVLQPYIIINIISIKCVHCILYVIILDQTFHFSVCIVYIVHRTLYSVHCARFTIETATMSMSTMIKKYVEIKFAQVSPPNLQLCSHSFVCFVAFYLVCFWFAIFWSRISDQVQANV